MKKSSLILALGAFPLYCSADIDDYFSISGFATTSIAKSDSDYALLINREIDNSTCFDCDTLLGVQLDYYYDSFRASAQVVKRPQDDWSSPQLEWAYVAYELGDADIRLGRLRLPLFLASEYYYVGHAYVSARPPVEIYDSILGITAFNGMSLTWNTDVWNDYSLSVTPFFGLKDTNKIDFASGYKFEFETEELFGLNATLTIDDLKLNATYLDVTYNEKVSGVIHYPIGDGSYVPVEFENRTDDVNMRISSVGAKYEFYNLALTSEVQRSVEDREERDSWYIGTDYNLGKFTPYAYLGQQRVNKKMSARSYLIGARYDLLYNVSVNVEWQQFKIYSETPFMLGITEQPEDDKANIYTVAINVIF